MANAMNLARSWETRENVFGYLAECLNKSRLNLVVGAGISKPLGLPLWGELLERLCEGATLPSDFPSLNAEKKVTYIKKTIFKNDEPKFHAALKQALYKDVNPDFQSLYNHKILASIGALVMSSRRGSVSKVVTFNFDDLLELYLNYYGYSCESITDSPHWSPNKDVVIYHPHGLVPHGTLKAPSKKIVLDSQSFHDILNKGDAWRSELCHLLCSAITIFIGVSGEDRHLDALLNSCKTGHAAIQSPKPLPYWGIWFTTEPDSANATIWRDYKVLPFKVNNYDEIPDILFKICQESAKNRM